MGPEVFDQLEAQEERELPEYLANSRFHKASHVWCSAVCSLIPSGRTLC